MLIRICDRENGILSVQLHEVMEILGSPAMDAQWVVGSVLSGDEYYFEGHGHDFKPLHNCLNLGEVIQGKDLYRISKTLAQIIWGKFTWIKSDDLEDKLLTVIFVDSSFVEFETEDRSILKLLKEKYNDVQYIRNF